MPDVAFSLRYASGSRTSGSLAELGVTHFQWQAPPEKVVGEVYFDLTPGRKVPTRVWRSIASHPLSSSVMVLDGAWNELFLTDAPMRWRTVQAAPSAAMAQIAMIYHPSSPSWLSVNSAGEMWRLENNTWSKVGEAGGVPTALVVDNRGTAWMLMPPYRLVVCGLNQKRRYRRPKPVSIDGDAYPGPGALALGPRGELYIAQKANRRISVYSAGRFTHIQGLDLPIDAPDLIAAGADGTLYCRNAPHPPTAKAAHDLGGQFFRRDRFGQWSPVTSFLRTAYPYADPLAVAMGADFQGNLFFAGATLASRRRWLTGPAGLAIAEPDGSFAWKGSSSNAAFQDREALPFTALASDGSPIGPVVLQIGVGTDPAAEGAPQVAKGLVVTAQGAPVTIPLWASGTSTKTFTVGAAGGSANGASGPSHGTLSAVDQASASVTYTPAAGFSGDDSFTYTATVGGASAPPATVQIRVIVPTPYTLTVSPGAAVLVPAPGVLGALTNRTVDVSRQSWQERRWPNLKAPTSVCYQRDGESLWVTTPGDFRARVWRREATGELHRYGGRAGAVDLDTPQTIVSAGAAVYVADTAKGTLVGRLASGIWSTVLDAAGVGGLCPHGSSVYFTTPAKGLVQRYVIATNAVEPVGEGATGTPPSAPGPIAVAGGSVWVIDQVANALYRLAKGGWTKYDSAQAPIGKLANPSAIAVDDQERVWIADTGNNRVVMASLTEGITFSIVDTQHGPLSAPQGISVDAYGGVWVADTGNDRLLHLACIIDLPCAQVELRADGSVVAESHDGLIGSSATHIGTKTLQGDTRLALSFSVNVPST